MKAKSARSGFLLHFEKEVTGLFHGLRATAPNFSSAFLVKLLAGSPQLEQWRKVGIELVTTAPQRAREGLSGLELVAEGVAALIGAEFAPGILRKESDRTQHGLGFQARVDTACFVALAGPRERVKEKSLLVLDDVLTTGTTLDLSAYVLRKAGARSVGVFALAHQVMPGLEGKREQAHEESGEVNPLLLHLRV